MHSVHDALFLKLYPDSIRSRPGKNDFEFDSGATVGQKRMLMHHINEVVADREQVGPDAEIPFQSLAGIDAEPQLRAGSGNRLIRDDDERHLRVAGALR